MWVWMVVWRGIQHFGMRCYWKIINSRVGTTRLRLPTYFPLTACLEAFHSLLIWVSRPAVFLFFFFVFLYIPRNVLNFMVSPERTYSSFSLTLSPFPLLTSSLPTQSIVHGNCPLNILTTSSHPNEPSALGGTLGFERELAAAPWHNQGNWSNSIAPV